MDNQSYFASQDGVVIDLKPLGNNQWQVVIQYIDGSSQVFDVLDKVYVMPCVRFKAGDEIGMRFGTNGCDLCSVALSMPAQFNVANSPLEHNGTLNVTWNSVSQHFVLAAPLGSSGIPVFRQLDYADLTGTPTTYTLPIASSTVLGGVKIGSGLSIDGSGVLSATGGVSDGNNYPTSLGFSGGVLTLGRSGLSNLTTSLDGRYLTSFSESDPIFTSSFVHGITSLGAGLDLTSGVLSATVTGGGGENLQATLDIGNIVHSDTANGMIYFKYGTNTIMRLGEDDASGSVFLYDYAGSPTLRLYGIDGSIMSNVLAGGGNVLLAATNTGTIVPQANGTNGQIMTMVSGSPAWATLDLSASYIKNQTSQQTGASFNVDGTGTIGTKLDIGGSSVDATYFSLGTVKSVSVGGSYQLVLNPAQGAIGDIPAGSFITSGGGYNIGIAAGFGAGSIGTEKVVFGNYIGGTFNSLIEYANGSGVLTLAKSAGISIKIGQTPATSAGSYDILTRDPASGNVEKAILGNGIANSSGTLSTKSRVLTTNTTVSGNVSTTQTDLHSYTIPAGLLANNGDSIRFRYGLKLAINGDTKNYTIHFGTQTPLGVTGSGVGDVVIEGTITRVDGTNQIVAIKSGGGDTVVANTQTLSGALVLKLTGTADASDDVKAYVSIIEFIGV